MIAWKIWFIHREVDGPVVAGVRLMGIMAVILESGMLFAMSINAPVILYYLLLSGSIHMPAHFAHRRKRHP